MGYDEYPKWVTAKNGEKVIVPDAQTEEAIVNGDVAPIEKSAGEFKASHVHEPSVGPVEQAAPSAGPRKKKKE